MCSSETINFFSTWSTVPPSGQMFYNQLVIEPQHQPTSGSSSAQELYKEGDFHEQHGAVESLLWVHLNCFSLHMNWISPSSSGSLHFNSKVEQSTTSGFKNKPRASLYSQSSGGGYFCMKADKTHTQSSELGPLFFNFTDCSKNGRTFRSMFSRISSMVPCCLIRSMALLGPIPLMLPQ